MNITCHELLIHTQDTLPEPAPEKCQVCNLLIGYPEENEVSSLSLNSPTYMKAGKGEKNPWLEIKDTNCHLANCGHFRKDYRATLTNCHKEQVLF
jgi:hypothetical protein